MNRSVFKEPISFLFKPITAQNTIFLDRDGVLNHVVFREDEISSPRSLEEFQLSEDIDALKEPWIQENWNLVVITNQPDLSRGLVTMDLLERFHALIAERIPVNAVYICPHLSADQCDCRKPACGLVWRFRRDQHLKGRELFIGDRKSDQECAKAAKILFTLRCRPYNQELIKNSRFTINNLGEIQTLIEKEVI